MRSDLALPESRQRLKLRTCWTDCSHVGIAVSGNIPKIGVSDAEALDDREAVEILLLTQPNDAEAFFFFQQRSTDRAAARVSGSTAT